MADRPKIMKDLQELVPTIRKELYPINDVRGMSGESIRQVLNSLVSQSKVYLECGLYCGRSFTSAMYGNENLTLAIGIDSWTEKFGVGIDPRKEFHEAVDKYYPKGVPFTLIEANHWDVKELPEAPDLYYYDGNHSAIDQEKALTHFGPMCAYEFTYCVDDWGWKAVREGTLKGLERFEVLDSWEKLSSRNDDPEWWNGFAVFKLRQK